MIQLPRGVQEAGGDIVRFEVRVVREDGLCCVAGREKAENIDDAHAHAPDARTRAALVDVNRNSGEEIGFAHGCWERGRSSDERKIAWRV